MQSICPLDFKQITFFTGAGMSAESGIPTYRGSGGIWHKYNWEEYACPTAFKKDPKKVLIFHELRRKSILSCMPNSGHYVIAELEKKHPRIYIVTQNIDGMHQSAGSKQVIELHGSIWRVRCKIHGIFEDIHETYERYTCLQCGEWLRPDIVWFGDELSPIVMQQAKDVISGSDLFISIGTSGVVWPAAGYPEIAKKSGAKCIEINPEASEMSYMYDEFIRLPAGKALPNLFQI